MKRMLWALAVVGLAAAGTAQADWGGFGPPTPQAGYPVQPVRNEFTAPNTLMGLGHAQSGRAPDRYGLLPGLRRAFRVNESCDSCGKPGLFSSHGSHGSSHGQGSYGNDYPQYPPINQGTLVFPNHQFIRSPRDFFMYEPGR